MDKYGVQFSQVDAAYPLSQEDGPLRGVPYVMKSIAWAAQIGCPCVDTTDGLHAPEGLKDKEAMTMMKRSYQQILKVAEAHKIIVNIEPHGYFTTNPDWMAEMQAFSPSPYLRLNMDTGNTFIAGHDPVKFLKAARAQWAITLEALRVAGIAAPDISATNRLLLEQETLVGLRNVAAKAAPTERVAALAAVKAEVDRLAAKYPDEPLMGSLASGYIKSMERAGATRDETQAQWAAFAAYPGTALANAAPAGAREAAARQQLGDRSKLPIELAFTAVDGPLFKV